MRVSEQTKRKRERKREKEKKRLMSPKCVDMFSLTCTSLYDQLIIVSHVDTKEFTCYIIIVYILCESSLLVEVGVTLVK